MMGYSTTQVQTQTQVEVLDAYEKYRYNGAIKVVPPYKWYSVVHELLNKPMHFWGKPLFIQKRFFEVDEHLVMSPREWTQYCGVEVLTAPMFNDFDMVVKDIGGKDIDYIKIVWMNNADKWKAIEAVNEYSILDNPPSGAVIVGSFIGGQLSPVWSGKYQKLFILRVNSKGHDEAPGYAVTDYTCNLFTGLTP
jgi:hypothetical protein